jgi:hypothetical protein
MEQKALPHHEGKNNRGRTKLQISTQHQYAEYDGASHTNCLPHNNTL